MAAVALDRGASALPKRRRQGSARARPRLSTCRAVTLPREAWARAMASSAPSRAARVPLTATKLCSAPTVGRVPVDAARDRDRERAGGSSDGRADLRTEAAIRGGRFAPDDQQPEALVALGFDGFVGHFLRSRPCPDIKIRCRRRALARGGGRGLEHRRRFCGGTWPSGARAGNCSRASRWLVSRARQPAGLRAAKRACRWDWNPRPPAGARAAAGRRVIRTPHARAALVPRDQWAGGRRPSATSAAWPWSSRPPWRRWR